MPPLFFCPHELFFRERHSLKNLLTAPNFSTRRPTGYRTEAVRIHERQCTDDCCNTPVLCG